MEYPKQLLRNIYWAFSEGAINSMENFALAITSYHRDISGSNLPVQLNEVIFNHPKIVLQYVKYDEEIDDFEEPQELVEADNGESFTVKELLYKIHQVGINLENEDNCYFEGLTFATSDDPDFLNIPVYFLDTGS